MKRAFFCICENKDAITAKLISAFVSTNTVGTIHLLPKFEISSLFPSSVAEQPGLCWTWPETPKTGFLMTRLYYGKTRVYRGAQFFLFFFLHHRLWVIVRTVALRRY